MDNGDNKGLSTGGVAALRRGLHDPAGDVVRREKIEAFVDISFYISDENQKCKYGILKNGKTIGPRQHRS